MLPSVESICQAIPETWIFTDFSIHCNGTECYTAADPNPFLICVMMHVYPFWNTNLCHEPVRKEQTILYMTNNAQTSKQQYYHQITIYDNSVKCLKKTKRKLQADITSKLTTCSTMVSHSDGSKPFLNTPTWQACSRQWSHSCQRQTFCFIQKQQPIWRGGRLTSRFTGHLATCLLYCMSDCWDRQPSKLIACSNQSKREQKTHMN